MAWGPLLASGPSSGERRFAQRLRSAALVGLAGSLLVACGGAQPAPADEAPSLQAVLSIERIEDVNDAASSSASAMAEFVILPADADAHATLDAAGLRTQLPERRGCSEAAGLRGGDGGALFPEQLELLEAGDVSIQADGNVTRLALYLFPPSGSASGVIYTTPDRSAPLPPGASYSISATGSDAIPPLTIREDAPSAPRDVTVGGVPLEGAVSLPAGQPWDFTWAEGEPGDRMLLEISGGESSVLCSFADDDGSGSVPASLTPRLGGDNARIALHRVRETTQAQEAPRQDALILETMVRFDFGLTSTVRVD